VPNAVELCRAATPVVLRRLPLTAALAVAVLGLGALSGARGTPADWLAGYVPLFLGLAVVGGFAEWRLGTRRAVVGAVVANVAGVGGAMLVLATAGRGWNWTTGPATHMDLGMTTAVLGAAATASANCGGRGGSACGHCSSGMRRCPFSSSADWPISNASWESWPVSRPASRWQA